jgi:general secretion pathway protein D
MTKPRRRAPAGGRRASGWVAALCVLTLAGCASSNYRKAQVAEQSGDWDAAVVEYMQALATEPANVSYRAGLLRAKIAASQAHFEKGKEYVKAGVPERALVELQQAVELDPSNQYAEVELQKVRRELEAKAAERPVPLTLEQLKEKTRGARPQPPQLEPRSKEPISLDFPKPVSVFDIYRALGKAFGINVLFDPNLKDQQMAIELKEVTAQAALETVMRSAGHFYKAQDPHTIIIAADTPQNHRIYDDQVMQTFFLSNAEPKEIIALLRSLVDAKKLSPNEALNAISIRDTADKVKIAESIIRGNDKSRAEVVVDVELLQINTTKLRELGMTLQPYQITQSVDLGSEDAKLHISDLEFLNQANWALTIPTFVYDFFKQSGDAQLLAKPQLRISEGETAKLLVGDKVPIPVTSFNTAQTAGGNIVPITSFQYQDVGIKIEIKPRVHHNKEVTLGLKVEVSNLGGSVGGTSGPPQPIISTRTIESTIRLKDGETNFLAGLIRSDSTNTDTGIPGISEIPVIGRLFSHNSTNNQRTDLIMTLTPHIIRTPDIEEQDLLPIWVGTEANISFRGGSPQVESESPGPFEEEATPEEVREMIRQRLQQLPRGLQEEGGDQPAQPEVQPPPGVNLVPAAPPTDIFTPEPTPPPETEPEEPPPGAAALDLDAGPGGELVATASAAAAAPAAVELSLLGTGARAGEEVPVVVMVRANSPVSHLPAALQFDAKDLEVVRVQPGNFLGPAGEAQVLADFSRPGEVLIGASRLGDRDGVTGSGVLATVYFKARHEGLVKVDWAVTQALDRGLQALAPLVARPLTLRIGEPRHEPRQRQPRIQGVEGP